MNLKLKIIVENCWNEDPFFRPSISQVSTTLHTLLSTVNEPEPKHEPEPEAEFASANPIPTESVYTTSHPTLPLANRFSCLAEADTE